MTAYADPLGATCPVPRAETEHVLLGHGSGGLLSARLLADLIVPALGTAASELDLDDAALLTSPAGAVLTTDSFVVDPLEFPGGDIGSLAVHGTVNDLAMRAARPVALAVALIAEEGLELALLRRIVASIGRAAGDAGVPVVTGDTKVVPRGCADRLFVTTTGVGIRDPRARCAASAIRPGDAVLLTGPLGLHGITVLAAREDLGFEADPRLCSDSRPLHRLVRAALDADPEIRAMRDPTRGGLASALNELAAASSVGMEVEEEALPVPDVVAAACDLLGLDPLHVANEGCAVLCVAPERADAVLGAVRGLAEGADAVRIGTATAEHPGRVYMRTLMGGRRVVDMLEGEQLPRIC